MDTFTRQQEIHGYSKIVSFTDIEKNEFNLNLPRYIDNRQAEDVQDIAGHLYGGIPVTDVDSLSRYWQICPELRRSLFTDNRPGYVNLAVDKAGIRAAIYDHPEFTAFIDQMNQHFATWQKKQSKTLRKLNAGCKPKEVIATVSEDLLAHYTDQPLISHYDVYQHLMDYWSDVMQDDVYQIAAEGWKAETYRIVARDNRGRERDRGWTCDLVPKSLVVGRYFADQQSAIDQLQADLEATTARKTELEEEHGGEEGLLAELERVNLSNVNNRLREIQDDAESADEVAILRQWKELHEAESVIKRQVRDAETALDEAAYARYSKLTEDEVKTLVVDDKWLARLDADIHGEMDRISQSLTQRVKELAERYETPLPQLSERVADLEETVTGHLERMGFDVSEPMLVEVGS